MTPNSTLEAVNIMLASIGETPVNRLSSGLVEAETAETILKQTSRSVQAEGWHFNRETTVTVAANLAGEIVLANNTIRADMMENGYKDYDLVQRGNRMYDRKNHTFLIKQPVQLDIVYELNFEDLPAVARRYITVKASRVLQDYLVGSPDMHTIHQEDELKALYELKDFENESSDYNIYNNYDVYRVLDRIGTKRVN